MWYRGFKFGVYFCQKSHIFGEQLTYNQSQTYWKVTKIKDIVPLFHSIPNLYSLGHNLQRYVQLIDF